MQVERGCAHQRAVVAYGAEVGAVQDIHPETAQQVATETDAEIATDELYVFFDCDLDGVIITTPPPVRREPVQLACEVVHLVRTVCTVGYYLNLRMPPWFLQYQISGGPTAEQAIHILDCVRFRCGSP